MQTLVIQTQHRENYAAHNEGYKHGVDEAHWKFKGGSTYFVTDLTEANVNSIVANGIPTLSKLIESFNPFFEEYIIDWEIRDIGNDDKGPICEEWEIPVKFTYRDGAWRCSTHHTPGDESYWNPAIRCRAEQWTPGVGGTRSDYQCQYKVANGWFDSKDPQLKKEVEAA